MSGDRQTGEVSHDALEMSRMDMVKATPGFWADTLRNGPLEDRLLVLVEILLLVAMILLVAWGVAVALF